MPLSDDEKKRIGAMAVAWRRTDEAHKVAFALAQKTNAAPDIAAVGVAQVERSLAKYELSTYITYLVEMYAKPYPSVGLPDNPPVASRG
jgi:hypothetical protein